MAAHKSAIMTAGTRLLLSLFAVQNLFSWASADVLTGLPTAPFSPRGSGSLESAKLTKIVVDSTFSDSRDTEGETLIPPSLEEFANTFAQDLTTLKLPLDVEVALGPESGSIFLTLGQSDAYRDEAGRKTSEGYTLTVQPDGVTISGASPLGVWWGTRTLMQQLVLGKGTLPLGQVVDRPGWPSRGLMVCSFFYMRIIGFFVPLTFATSLTLRAIITLRTCSLNCALLCHFSSRIRSTFISATT